MKYKGPRYIFNTQLLRILIGRKAGKKDCSGSLDLRINPGTGGMGSLINNEGHSIA